MRSILLLTFGVIWTFQACSPEPVYRLKAEAEEDQTSYYQGVEYIHMEKDSVQLTVSYYEHTSDFFALDVEVLNNSNRIVRVAPESFAYESYDGYPPENPGNLLKVSTAKDPEQKLLNIDLALSKQKAQQKGDEFFFFALQGLTLAKAITADSKEEQEEAGEDLVENTVRQQIDRSEYRHNRSGLHESREFWKAEALRITDLWPGESIRGLVYFENNPDAILYNILAEIEDLHFNTWFMQQKHYPENSIDQE